MGGVKGEGPYHMFLLALELLVALVGGPGPRKAERARARFSACGRRRSRYILLGGRRER